MSDERFTQHLEQQLVNAHAANAEPRERLVDTEKQANTTRAQLADATFVQQDLERTNAKLKASEDNAAAAQRDAKDEERKRLRAEDKLAKVTAELERVRAEADTLQALNDRIEQAKHVGDLFVS